MLKKGKDLTSILLKKNSTLNEAILKMNMTGFKILYVVDKKRIFLGTLSDGDIRRALANKILPSDQISKIYNKRSIILKKNINYSHQSIKKFFYNKHIFSIPLLDKKKIVGFYDIRDFLIDEFEKTVVLIMAGGFGKRLMPLTKNTPKPMLPINGKPILQIMIENLRTQNFNNIYISTYYKSKVIKNFFKDGKNFLLKINYLDENKPLGTIGCLKFFRNKLDYQKTNIIIVNGDILTDVNFRNILNFHNEHNSDFTIAIKNMHLANDFGIIKRKGIYFKNIEEKPVNLISVNAGIYIIKTKIIKKIKFRNKMDITALIEKLKKQKKKIIIYPIHENWTDIGTLAIYNKYK